MLFSGIPFLYFFLPAVLLLYFVLPRRYRNLLLLITSVFFYFWGEPVYLLLILFSTVSDWLLGFLIDGGRGTWRSKAGVITSIGLNIGLLGLFKYADFFIENLNRLPTVELQTLGLALPIGISFYSFQTLSYTIDLYRGEAKLQRNLLDFATYVTLFPQLIAGPIVRYTTVEKELSRRKTTLVDFGVGARRFVFGLGKKVLLANLLGELCEIYKEQGGQSVLFTWLYGISFALHIYFDFSGYSDMAIGLGRIFGFRFLENFQYPYMARLVTDFWRRWHISLGSWFRDYVYIPLGGNRRGAGRLALNLLIVWFLTGFWHGAGWNFILWGLFYGVLILAEKFVFGKQLKRIPRVFSHLYLILATIIGWILFDAGSLGEAVERMGLLFGVNAEAAVGEEVVYYGRSYLVPLIIALVAATSLPKKAVEFIQSRQKGPELLAVLEPLVVGIILITATAYLVDGSYNPFIYFRF